MYRYFTLLVCLTLTACGGNTIEIAPNERFTAAYPLANGTVRVRYSSDGMTWSTADSFPLLRATDHGPGLAATDDGVTYAALGQEQIGSTMKRWLAFSLGSDAYDDLVDQPLIPEIWTSAPAIAWAGGQDWMIAFRSGSRVKLFRYNADDDTADELDLVGDAFNTGVSGRPGLAVIGDRLVLTFHSNPPGPQIGPAVRALSGVINDDGVTFDSVTEVLGASPQMPAIERFHDLSDDGSSFVLGAVFRDTPSGDPLATHTLLVLTSADGTSWSERTRMGAATPLGRSVRLMPMSIGALSDGTVIAAFSNGNLRELFRFSGGQWSELPGSSVFDLTPAGGFDFALISGGRP